MEEILPTLKNMLKESIDITSDRENKLIRIKVKTNIKGKFADKEEIITMLKMFGGLRQEIPMNLIIDDNNQIIEIKFETEEKFKKIQGAMEYIWDNTIDLLENALQGDFKKINELPNIDD